MKKNNLLKALSCLLAVAILFGCSLAYFTDYATTSTSGTAGTVALSMDSDINLLNADGMDIINPGDMRDGSFSVTNEGNKSIDVRSTIVLTTVSNTGYDLAFTGDATTQSEYDLYLASDVELVEGYGYQPKDGAQPLQVKSVDGNTITYVLPEYSLNGNSDRYDEVETIDGVNAFSYDYDFVFVMKGSAGNEWQNSAVSIDVLVEAKQHENTNAGWDIVAHENVSIGSINQSAVKGEDVITGGDVDEKPIAFSGSLALKSPTVDPTGFTVTVTNSADPTDEFVATLDENGAFSIDGLQPNAQYNVVFNGQYTKMGMILNWKMNCVLDTAETDVNANINASATNVQVGTYTIQNGDNSFGFYDGICDGCYPRYP